MLRATVEHLALSTGLFDAVRSAYHVVGNRPYRAKLQARQALFAEFVREGYLVFDVGANHGEFAICFRRLGAQVLCIEPNPACAAKLRARFGQRHVVEAALSDYPGQTTLYLGSDSNYSTIVSDWLDITRDRDRLSDRTVSVTVTTLDHLIDRYGLPDFLKIDVEANELPVLRGLSTPVRGLIFEYQCPRLSDVPPALDHLDSLAPYEYALLEHGRLTWLPRADLLIRLHQIADAGVQSGDIYARYR